MVLPLSLSLSRFNVFQNLLMVEAPGTYFLKLTFQKWDCLMLFNDFSFSLVFILLTPLIEIFNSLDIMKCIY